MAGLYGHLPQPFVSKNTFPLFKRPVKSKEIFGTYLKMLNEPFLENVFA